MPASALATTTTLNTAPTGINPVGITIDSAGNIYTANHSSSSVSKITPAGLTTTLNNTPTGINPYWITIDSAGNIYTSNYGSNSVSKITPAGVTTTLAATGLQPAGITIDSAGNIYTANTNSNSVSKITPSGLTTTLNNIATGVKPFGITVDSAGNVYTSNYGSNSVSKITPAGVTTTLNNTAIGIWPYGITIDSVGNIYTANYSSNSVSKVTPAGVVTTLNDTATGRSPLGITIDSAGNIYTSNYGVNSVSKITPSGLTTTLNDNTTGMSPAGITVDSAGNIYTANINANSVTKISAGGGIGNIFAAPPARPSAPTARAGVELATVTVAVNPVSARYGVPISYTLTAAQDTSKSCLVTVPATSCQVTGLTGGTSYTFTSRANLNIWQTAVSSPSAAVTPTHSTTLRLAVRALKAHLDKTGAYLTSLATVNLAGKIVQTATTGAGRKKKTWCKAAGAVNAAGSYVVKCNLGANGRGYLRRQALKLTVTTVFRRSTGAAVTKSSKLTINRSR